MQKSFFFFCLLSIFSIGHANSLSKSDISFTVDSSRNLAERYISNGEDLLLSGNYQESVEPLLTGYEIATADLSEESLRMRSLFSLLIAYGHLGEEEPIHNIIHEMSYATNYSICNCDSKNDVPPILGPDKVSIEECVYRIKNTKRLAILLCAAIPKAPARALVITAIDGLAQRGIDCCYAGGLWKTCIYPLLEKWYALQRYDDGRNL